MTIDSSSPPGTFRASALIVVDKDQTEPSDEEVEPRLKKGEDGESTVEPKSKKEDEVEKVELPNEGVEHENK